MPLIVNGFPLTQISNRNCLKYSPVPLTSKSRKFAFAFKLNVEVDFLLSEFVSKHFRSSLSILSNGKLPRFIKLLKERCKCRSSSSFATDFNIENI